MEHQEYESRNGPLSGIRILDLTQVVAGPFCTMMLANLGAEVVKLEPAGRGDEMRSVGRYRGREDHEDYFHASNYSKKSIGLNLKDPEQRSVGQALAARANAVVENYAPGTAARLGMGWEDLRPLNERLVYCSISGFGQSGVYGNRVAMDPIIQAVSGVMSVTGFPDGGPVMIGAPLADVISGMFAAYAVLGALYGVRDDGKGRYVDVAMQASMLAALSPRMGESLQAGISPVRLGNQNPMRVPSDVYPTKDGVELFVMVQNQRVWEPLCRALGCPEWNEDPRFESNALRVKNRDVINRLVAGRIAELPSADVMASMEAERVPFARVNDYARALTDPQVVHRGQIRTVEHPTSGRIRVIGPPWVMSGVTCTPDAPPLLDQHRAEVLLEWLEWDEATIARFCAAHPGEEPREPADGGKPSSA